jgi:uncharacterized protein YdeI (YjbR/CyaY-like superfamily)
MLSFATAGELRNWLGENHASSEGVWLRFAKKGSGEVTVTFAEALDQALCHGWIDGQKRALDEKFWMLRFTPRRPKSNWSKLNIGHVERLIQAGQMTSTGLCHVEAAKADGRWQKAYDSPANAKPPEDFLKELKKSKKAAAFFKTLNRANVYAAAYRLQTAKKPETRERRKREIIEMLERGEKFHA